MSLQIIEGEGARHVVMDSTEIKVYKEGESHTRNQNLRRIDEVGQKVWKKESGYHRRSLAETLWVTPLAFITSSYS